MHGPSADQRLGQLIKTTIIEGAAMGEFVAGTAEPSETASLGIGEANVTPHDRRPDLTELRGIELGVTRTAATLRASVRPQQIGDPSGRRPGQQLDALGAAVVDQWLSSTGETRTTDGGSKAGHCVIP